MGSDKAKREKKRLKAQVKTEKARLKSDGPQAPSPEPEKSPWYKDPHWVRAIIAIATLIVMVVTLIVTLQF